MTFISGNEGRNMSFKNKDIIIQDWAGNQLYIGPYDADEVDAILDVNKCRCRKSNTLLSEIVSYFIVCPECRDTGYIGDIEVYWQDESDKKDCNVYEYINY